MEILDILVDICFNVIDIIGSIFSCIIFIWLLDRVLDYLYKKKIIKFRFINKCILRETDLESEKIKNEK